MPASFLCPYLGAEIELTDERKDHITKRHPDFIEVIERIRETLAQPDTIYAGRYSGDSHLFERWYDQVYGGKFVQVAVLEAPPGRYWIVTAHISRKPAPWRREWTRS
ncbi:MAG TPA: hypothetical protein VH951_07850 [Dehalococcoidia bacterium]|jgi:hypothetical protein